MYWLGGFVFVTLNLYTEKSLQSANWTVCGNMGQVFLLVVYLLPMNYSLVFYHLAKIQFIQAIYNSL